MTGETLLNLDESPPISLCNQKKREPNGGAEGMRKV
jgi:hypothetical protein